MNNRTSDITKAALFAAVMSVSAYCRLPIGPVPITLQTAGALIAGYCLGPRLGATSMLLYTAVGLAGVPVFASGGGPVYILSPTFGYIIGFTVCAAFTGALASFNRNDSFLKACMIMLLGLAGIYVPGVLWLIVSLNWIAKIPTPAINALKIGLFIPIIGDIITIPIAVVLSLRIRKILSR